MTDFDVTDSPQVMAEYKAATLALRDAELAMRACQERYKLALVALNNSIAPTDSREA